MSSAPPLHLVYDGYDPSWILGRDKGPPVVPKPPPPAAPPAAPASSPAPPPVPPVSPPAPPASKPTQPAQPAQPAPPAPPAPPTKPTPPPVAEQEPVVLKVHFCCEGCVEKMKAAFSSLDGMERVVVDPASSRVTITGKVNVEACLKLARRIYKRSELWPTK